jgi:hypothetical protein
MVVSIRPIREVGVTNWRVVCIFTPNADWPTLKMKRLAARETRGWSLLHNKIVAPIAPTNGAYTSMRLRENDLAAEVASDAPRTPPSPPTAKHIPTLAASIRRVREAYRTKTARTALQEKFQMADHKPKIRKIGCRITKLRPSKIAGTGLEARFQNPSASWSFAIFELPLLGGLQSTTQIAEKI